MAKSKILSGEELWNQRKIMAQSVPITGVKEYAPDGSWLENKRLQCFYSDRREILSEERLDKLSSLASAEWQAELGVAEIKKDLGKFNSHVGHMLHYNRKVLYPEEALMLLESNSLEIYFKDVSLSVQEAFATLLSKDITLEQYQVYNHLSRFGYIVRRHQEKYVPTEYEKKLGLDRFIETNLENQKQAKFDRLSRYGKKYSKKHRESSEDETSRKQMEKMETERIQEDFDSTRNESSENKEKNKIKETSVDDYKKNNVFNNENIFAKSSSESKSISKKKEMIEILENIDLKEHTESSKKQERNRNKKTSINDTKKMCISENAFTSNSSEIQSNSKNMKNAAEMVQENCEKLETYYKDSQSKNKDKDCFKDIRAADIPVLDKLQSREFENHFIENDPGENKFNDDVKDPEVKDPERKKKHSKNKFNDVKDHGQKKKHRDRHHQDYERKEHSDRHLDSVDHQRKEHRKKRSYKKSSHDKIRDSKSKESDDNLYSFSTENDRNIQDKEENSEKSHGSPCKRRKCSSDEESSQHLQEHSVQHRQYWSELDHITCPVYQSKKIYTCWEFSEINFLDFGGGQTDIEIKSPTENLLPPNIKIRQSDQPLNISNFIEEQNFQSRRQYNKSRQGGYDESCSGWNYKPPVHTKANNWAEYKIELQKTLNSRSTLDYNLPNSGVRPLVDWRSSKSLEMVIRRLDIIPVIKKHEQKDLKLAIPKIMFDVYLPDPNFKKSNPGVPDHYLMVLSYLDPPPLQSHLAYMMRSIDDTRPLHIAVVDHGDISFYAFNNISLGRHRQVRK